MLSLRFDVMRCTWWDSLTSKYLLLALQLSPSVLFTRISNISSEMTFRLRDHVTSSRQWCPSPGGSCRQVTKVSRLSCQHRFRVLSGVCEELGWYVQRLPAAMQGYIRIYLMLLSSWTYKDFVSVCCVWLLQRTNLPFTQEWKDSKYKPIKLYFEE